MESYETLNWLISLGNEIVNLKHSKCASLPSDYNNNKGRLIRENINQQQELLYYFNMKYTLNGNKKIPINNQ